MYAVVATGGKQLKVEKGAEAVVEKLDAAIGEAVTLDVVFIADGDSIVTDADALSSATVTAEVVEHFKDDKVVVFKFKKRKGYKRTKGHRQQLTRVRITDIAAGAAKPARKKAEPAAEAATEGKAAKAAKAESGGAKAAKPRATRAKKDEAPAAEAEAKPKRTRAKKEEAPEAEKAEAAGTDESGE